MICPRCNKPTLEERERDRVTIDVCQECRGIWLDRGELERLIAMADRDLGRNADPYKDRYEQHGHHNNYDSHHKDHSYTERHSHDHGHHHRKRNWLSEIFD